MANAEVNQPGTEVKASSKTAPTSRSYFLDNLKVFLTALVVLHHAAQPYGPGGGWWIAPEPYSTLDLIVLGLFMVINMSFFMGLFFAISAYFVPSSLERKGAAQFVRDRLVRLGVPILIFVVAVFPAMGYLLNGEPSIGLSHLWFLELLLVFSAVYAAYWLIKKPSLKTKPAFPDNAAIAAYTVVMALITFVVAIWCPINFWLPLSLFEPFHMTQYVMMFIAGIIAYREGWMDTIPEASAKLWSRVAILMLILFIFVDAVSGRAEFSGGLSIASLLGSLWMAFTCVSVSIALLAYFKKRFNAQGPLAKALANNSFTVYLIHIPIIVVLQYLLIGVAVDPLVKFAVVGAAGIMLSFAISHYVIRRLPYARNILG